MVNLRGGDALQTGPIPNLFLVGAPRAATTSIYSCLKQHPGIFLSLLKEPIYFGSDLSKQPLAVEGLSEYMELFRGAAEYNLIGEGSVFYLMSRTAAYEIKEFSPGAKILIVLRNPIDAMQSLHALYLRTGNEDAETLELSLSMAERRKLGLGLPPRCYFAEGLQYLEVFSYADQVRRFVDAFGRGAVHIMIYDDLVANMELEISKVFNFLGVPERSVIHDSRKSAALIRPIVLRQMRAVGPALRSKIKFEHDHMGVYKKSMPSTAIMRLKECILPDVRKLSEIVGRDLADWCRP